ncbi:hypothetical protein O7627_02975 [Solwaraspora sp. WMMD1047]|uniref:hypothetical protein n=1 Tax=Solwaraspora sp. WMMD1047 TaxID=3016102 RepID=UPI0024172A7D|nr:hypothetical protein [Solwaraspora sp. WMMD1047]MDG4828267.1 hypothetical protein [Solwaraspora sp. WMMD1047]
MSVYLSVTAYEELHAAQDQLDRHTPNSGNGLCSGCEAVAPCGCRRAALRVFGRYGVLPRRWPGATRPDLIGRSGPWAGWLPAVDGASGPNG